MNTNRKLFGSWSEVIFTVTVLLMAVEFLQTVTADKIDDQLNAEKDRLTAEISKKCKEKSNVPMSTLMKVAKSCAEPVLKQSSFIPKSLFPNKYNSLMNDCGKKMGNNANVCDKKVMDAIMKCVIQKGFSSLPQLKQLYEKSKPQIANMVTKLMNNCVPAIKKI